jgi:FixJ family two-component response regulator
VPTTRARTTIAIVDDDDGVRRSLHALLRAADFGAVAFASAEEFLSEGLRGGRDGIDCLVVDVNLPGMSGVALVKRLATAGSRIPAILITGREDFATMDLIKRAGSVPYLHKPFSDDDLLATISELVRHRCGKQYDLGP